MKFSKNVKKFRHMAGLTQEQLATEVGVSPQAVSKWENSDTYPDASLLIPIADILGVSLDCLFGNDKVYDGDTARRLYQSLELTEREKRMEKVLSFCWHIEKALFGDDNKEYNPDARKFCATSYIDTDNGFTYVSNSAPFFAVFPEPEDGRKMDADKTLGIFKLLSDIDVLSAVLFLMKTERSYTFEKEVLARNCGIQVDNITKVMEKLEQVSIVHKKIVNINDKSHTLYFYTPRCEILMLMIAAGEIGYNGRYTLQADMRHSPYLNS